MFTKIIYPDAFNFGMPAASLIEHSRRGFETGMLRKRAAIFDDELRNIDAKPGYSYVHLITTGGMETYGPNSNADAFNKQACEYTIPRPEDGKSFLIKLGGGLDEFHNPTFLEYGGVYKNHKNRHAGGKSSGYIVKAAVNNEMNRGELIVGLDNKLWDKELHKLAEDRPIFFSMACDIAADLCTDCGHRRRNVRESCDHVKNHLMKIASDGRQICLINDTPLFHDISGVPKPADKIAHGLRKVAMGGVIDSAILAQELGIAPVSVLQKIAGRRPASRYELLSKLAKIEKEIMTGAHSADDICCPFSPEGGFNELDDRTTAKLGSTPPGALFGALKNHIVILPVETFYKIIMGKDYQDVAGNMPDVKDELPGIFGKVLDSPDVGDFLDDGSYEPTGESDGDANKEVDKLVGSHSLAAEPVRVRTIKATISAKPKQSKHGMPKEAALVKSATVDFLAREYAKYALSFAEGLPADKLYLTVAQMTANSIYRS